jgi:hypothetical protein
MKKLAQDAAGCHCDFRPNNLHRDDAPRPGAGCCLIRLWQYDRPADGT